MINELQEKLENPIKFKEISLNKLKLDKLVNHNNNSYYNSDSEKLLKYIPISSTRR